MTEKEYVLAGLGRESASREIVERVFEQVRLDGIAAEAAARQYGEMCVRQGHLGSEIMALRKKLIAAEAERDTYMDRCKVGEEKIQPGLRSERDAALSEGARLREALEQKFFLRGKHNDGSSGAIAAIRIMDDALAESGPSSSWLAKHDAEVIKKYCEFQTASMKPPAELYGQALIEGAERGGSGTT